MARMPRARKDEKPMQSRSNTAIRVLVRVWAGVAFIAAVLFGFSDPVAAKGPQSVTITGPGMDRPIELMDSANSDLVVRLMEQTGLWYAAGELPLPLEHPAGDLGPAYTLAWINSGPPGKSVDERTIRQEIYLYAENGPVIHTPAQETLGGWGPDVIGWFAAPSGLRDTLAELGVPVSPASSLREVADSEIAAGAALSERKSSGAPWYLGVVGFALLIGLAGALVAHLIKGRYGVNKA